MESKDQLHADELAIRALSARFSDVCVLDDAAGFREVWAPNGVWEVGQPFPTRAEGVDAVCQMYTQLRAPWTTFLQMTHSGLVKVEGDRARARWILQEFGINRETGGNYNNFGVYVDNLVKLEGAWKFARRAYNYLWLDVETKIPGNGFAVPESVKKFLGA